MKKILPLIGIAAAAAYFLNQSRQLKTSLRVSVGKILFNLKETQRALFSNLVLDVNLNIENSSKIQGKINGANLDFIIDNRKIGSVNNTSAIIINSSATTVFPVQVRLNTLSLFPSISDLIKKVGSGRPININIVGSVFTSFGEIVVNQKMSFSL